MGAQSVKIAIHGEKPNNQTLRGRNAARQETSAQ
jgi:hypothetical protein